MNLQIGLLGLGKMGRNLALNWKDHGIPVLGFDTDHDARNLAVKERACQTYGSFGDLIKALSRPRVICLMIPSDNIDACVQQLLRLLDEGDTVVDAGNTHYEQTENIQRRLQSVGIGWVGAGVSGGLHGARHGPAIMVGGDPLSIKKIEPFFRPIAAKADDGAPCFLMTGPAGSGHFVKMVHNGIEYADMQAIAESAFLIQKVVGLEPAEVASIFAEWNDGILGSFLLETAIEALRAKAADDSPLINLVSDHARSRGTGRWMVSAAMSLGVAVPSIASAVFARLQSSSLEDRACLQPGSVRPLRPERIPRFLKDLMSTLLGSRTATFVQGLNVIQSGSRQHEWNIDIADVLRVWRSGCIIRGYSIQEFLDSLGGSSQNMSLLSRKKIQERLAHSYEPWTEIVGYSAYSGIPTPTLSAGLQWLTTFRTRRLWTNLTQAQRDLFGGHGLEKSDLSGPYPANWSK